MKLSMCYIIKRHIQEALQFFLHLFAIISQPVHIQRLLLSVLSGWVIKQNICQHQHTSYPIRPTSPPTRTWPISRSYKLDWPLFPRCQPVTFTFSTVGNTRRVTLYWMTRVAVGQGEVTVADGVFGAAACGDTVSSQTRHDSRKGHMKFRPDLFIEIYMEPMLVKNCDFDHTDAYTCQFFK